MYFDFISKIISSAAKVNEDELEHIARLIVNANRVYIAGNGASAALANHFATDLVKLQIDAISLCNNEALITAISNDNGYEMVFTEQLRFAKFKDILIAISASGESKNVIEAIRTAKSREMQVITITGFKPNNTVRQMGDVNIFTGDEDYGVVECIHNIVLHFITNHIKEKINGG